MHARNSPLQPEAPTAVIVHELQGRTRLRIRTKRDDARYFSRLLKFLETIPEVTKALARPKTASLLLHHTGGFDALAARCEEEGLFVVVEPKAVQDISLFIAEGATIVHNRLRGATSGAVGLDSATALLLTGLGVLQLARGEALPPAVTLILGAAELLRFRSPRGGATR